MAACAYIITYGKGREIKCENTTPKLYGYIPELYTNGSGRHACIYNYEERDDDLRQLSTSNIYFGNVVMKHLNLSFNSRLKTRVV